MCNSLMGKNYFIKDRKVAGNMKRKLGKYWLTKPQRNNGLWCHILLTRWGTGHQRTAVTGLFIGFTRAVQVRDRAEESVK